MKTFVCRGCVNPVWYRMHKCRYWCQCKSGVGTIAYQLGYIIVEKTVRSSAATVYRWPWWCTEVISWMLPCLQMMLIIGGLGAVVVIILGGNVSLLSSHSSLTQLHRLHVIVYMKWCNQTLKLCPCYVHFGKLYLLFCVFSWGIFLFSICYTQKLCRLFPSAWYLVDVTWKQNPVQCLYSISLLFGIPVLCRVGH